MKILLADDEVSIQKLISGLLEDEGHECVCVEDGTDALEAFEKLFVIFVYVRKPLELIYFFLTEPRSADIFLLKGKNQFNKVVVSAFAQVYIVELQLLVMIQLVIFSVYGKLHAEEDCLHLFNIIIRNGIQRKNRSIRIEACDDEIVFPYILSVQMLYKKPFSAVVIDDSVSNKPNQGFSDRRSADSEDFHEL